MANAVIRLSGDLQPLDYWATANWAALSRSDTDVGSIGPALLDDDQVFQSGKNGVGQGCLHYGTGPPRRMPMRVHMIARCWVP